MILSEVQNWQKKIQKLIDEEYVISYSSDVDQLPLSELPPALGITPVEGKDYKLAIYAQSEESLNNYINSSRVANCIKEIGKENLDIQVVGEISAYCNSNTRKNKIGIGASISHEHTSSGTLGCFVRKLEQAELFILSNNHILANENQCNIGDLIFHPSVEDQDLSQGVDFEFAVLDHFVPLCKNSTNLIDAALARVTRPESIDPCDIPGIGSLKGTFNTRLRKRLPVAKFGRTTKLTKGRIRSLNVLDTKIGFRTGRYSFSNLITIESEEDTPFSLPGDSGSLIVDQKGCRAIALLLAGAPYGGRNNSGITFAVPISTILKELNIELVVHSQVTK